jgi:hypothetical protein
MRTYKDKIENLKHNQVYCFGANNLGINGSLRTGKGGAALFALKKGWVKQGEKMNNCLSSCGKAWGIVTVTGPGKKKSKTPEEISNNILKLYNHAKNNPDDEFLVAYTGLSGYNLNGYTNKELAQMFSSNPIPENMVFEEEFATLLKI